MDMASSETLNNCGPMLSKALWEQLYQLHSHVNVHDLDKIIQNAYEDHHRGQKTGSHIDLCSQMYLDEIITDLVICEQNLSCNEAQNYPKPEAWKRSFLLMLGLYLVKECRRLLSNPELFPSKDSQDRFRESVLRIVNTSPLLHQLSLPRPNVQTRSSSWYLNKPASHLTIFRGHLSYKEPNPEYKDISELHPHAPTKRHVWNKWLDNCNDEENEDGQILRVRQQVPVIAVRLLRRTRFMYGVVERSYQAAGRVLNQRKNSAELSALTGEDYKLLSQLPNSQFRFCLPHFSSGERNGYDSDGILTVEELARVIRRFQKRRFALNTANHAVCTITRV